MARMQTAETTDKVGVGTQFRAVIADCNALWEVKQSRGRDAWECEVIPEPQPQVIDLPGGKQLEYRGDYLGHRQVFGGDVIRHSVGLASYFEQRHLSDVAWLKSLQVGDIIHHCDSRPDARWQPLGDWHRLRVVATYAQEMGVSVELVGYAGNFRHSLGGEYGRRLVDGTVHHDVQRLIARVGERHFRNGTGGTTYEAPDFAYRQECEALKVNPAALPLIDLTVPEPTPAEAACKALLDGLNAVREIEQEKAPWCEGGWKAHANLPRQAQTQARSRFYLHKLARIAEAAQAAIAAFQAQPLPGQLVFDATVSDTGVITEVSADGKVLSTLHRVPHKVTPAPACEGWDWIVDTANPVS